MDKKTDYIFDVNKIIEFVSDTKPVVEREIIDWYENYNDESGAIHKNKQTREATTSNNQPRENIRYDVIKLLLTTILSCDENNFGTQIAINTLKENKMLI